MATAIPIGSSKEPKFDLKSTIRQDVLNKTDLMENNNKFFSIELQESYQGTFRVFTNYGRVGNTGVSDGRYYPDKDSAEIDYEKIIKTKLSKHKGYVKVEVAKSAVGSKEAQKILKVTELPKSTKILNKTSSSCSISKSIIPLVEQVYEDASQTLQQSYNVTIDESGVQTPLGALSQKQIDLGKSLIIEMRKYLTDKPGLAREASLIRLSGKYFSNIPRILPPFPDPREAAILSKEKADSEEELLLLMQDIFDMKGEMVSDLDNKYKALRTKISLVEFGNPDYDRIIRYVKTTQSKHHGVDITVNRIYSLQLDADHSRFNPLNITPVKELFHGSRNSNILGILTKGLLIAPKNVPSTGYMFGKGIYFADKSTKSTQYSTGRFDYGYKSKRNNAFLFLADVAVGKMKEFAHSHYQDEAPSGYNSVKGVEGHSLLHNEYIVYNVNQAKIKYVVDFSIR